MNKQQDSKEKIIQRLPKASDAFADAVGAPTMTFSHSGAISWSVTADYWLTGGSSVKSGEISNNQFSAFTTTVNGPGQISFYWCVSSEPSFDILEFKVDGITRLNISGSVNWREEKVYLDENRLYTLSWEYSKDGSSYVGADAGWVDSIAFTPGVSVSSVLDTTLTFYNHPDYPWTESTNAKVGAKSLKAQPGVGLSTSIYTEISQKGVLSWWWLKSGATSDLMLMEDDEIVSTINENSVWQYQKHAVTSSFSIDYTFMFDQSSSSDYALLDGVKFTPCDPIRNINLDIYSSQAQRGESILVGWGGAEYKNVAIFLITKDQNISIARSVYSYSIGGSYSFTIPDSATLGTAKIQIMQTDLVENSFFSEEFEITLNTSWVAPVAIGGIFVALVIGAVVVVKQKQLKRMDPSLTPSDLSTASTISQGQSFGSMIIYAFSKESPMPKPISVRSTRYNADMSGRNVQPLSLRYKKT